MEKPDSYKSWDFVYVINLYENAELICVSLPPSSFLFLFHKYSDSRELGSIIVTVSFSEPWENVATKLTIAQIAWGP